MREPLPPQLLSAFRGPGSGVPSIQDRLPIAWGQTSLQSLENLEGNLALLEQHTLLAPLPTRDPLRAEAASVGATDFFPEAEADRDHPVRVRAVRARLQRLGYLDQDSEAETVEPDLRHAISQFQTDAGITSDGWVGAETWEALQELVAFEPSFTLTRWTVDGVYRPVLVRATQLRLKVLGLYPGRVTGIAEDGRLALQRFKFVVRQLALGEGTDGLSDTAAIDLLFAHDGMLRLLSDGADALLGMHLPIELKPAAIVSASLERRFLLHMIRVELWLLGYKPGELLDALNASTLKKALAQFWKDHASVVPEGLSLDVRERLHKYVQPHLFRAFGTLLSEERSITDREIITFVEANEESLRPLWYEAVRRPVFYIWDGLKRSFRWLGRQVGKFFGTVGKLVEQGIEYAREFVQHLAHVVYRGASGVLTVIRRAVATFLKGMGFYVRGEVRTPQMGPIACGLSVDCDSVLFVGADSTAENLEAFSLTMRVLPRALSAAAFVISEVIGLFLQFTIGPLGWLLVVTKLLKLGPRLWMHARELAEASEALDAAA